MVAGRATTLRKHRDFFCFVDFAFIDLLIYQLAARREIKFSPKMGLNFKISYYAIFRAELIFGALCMTARPRNARR